MGKDSSTNKTDRHDIIEILLKVALNTITLTSKGRTIYSRREVGRNVVDGHDLNVTSKYVNYNKQT
jgi:hypothetical protein